MVTDVSTFRIDHMPYGGVKLSGFGREGARYAIEEMTEMKLVTSNRRPWTDGGDRAWAPSKPDGGVGRGPWLSIL